MISQLREEMFTTPVFSLKDYLKRFHTCLKVKSIKKNTMVDCIDNKGFWQVARIIKCMKNTIEVYFCSKTKHENEILPRDTWKIAPLYSHTRHIFKVRRNYSISDINASDDQTIFKSNDRIIRKYDKYGRFLKQAYFRDILQGISKSIEVMAVTSDGRVAVVAGSRICFIDSELKTILFVIRNVDILNICAGKNGSIFAFHSRNSGEDETTLLEITKEREIYYLAPEGKIPYDKKTFDEKSALAFPTYYYLAYDRKNNGFFSVRCSSDAYFLEYISIKKDVEKKFKQIEIFDNIEEIRFCNPNKLYVWDGKSVIIYDWDGEQLTNITRQYNFPSIAVKNTLYIDSHGKLFLIQDLVRRVQDYYISYDKLLVLDAYNTRTSFLSVLLSKN